MTRNSPDLVDLYHERLRQTWERPEVDRLFAQLLERERPDLVLCDHADDTLDGADVLAVVTEWIEFRSPDFEEIRARLRFPAIFDGRNIYDPQTVTNAGLVHYSIGRRLARPD